MGQARKSKKQPTAEEKRRKAIAATCIKVGLPEIQRDADTLVIETTAIIDGHTRPERDTVRKLSRIEMLHRSGALTTHEAAACQWYADRHALGFDTIGCTANYEGGGGGGFGSSDLLARHKVQADARDDFAHYRGLLAQGVLPAYLAIFDEIVLGQDTIGAVAARAFDLARSQAEHKTRNALRFCANRLGMLIAHLLPIDPAELAQRPRPEPEAAATAPSQPQPDRAVQLFLDGKIAIARLGGDPAAIRIAELTLQALRRETGCGDDYAGIPLVKDEGWSWGCIVVSAEEQLLAGLIAAPGTIEGAAAG